jgi:hypothetical protein
MEILLFILIIAVIVITILLIKSRRKTTSLMNTSETNWNLYLDERELRSTIENNLQLVLDSKADLEGKYADAKDRIDELNLSLKEGYGIKAMVNVKEVKLDFKADERVLLLEAVEFALESGGPIEKLKVMLPLLDKMYTVFMEANEVDAEKELQEIKNKRVGRR